MTKDDWELDPKTVDVVLDEVHLERRFLGTVVPKGVKQSVGYAATVRDTRADISVQVELTFLDTDDDIAAVLTTSYTVVMAVPQFEGRLTPDDEARLLSIANDYSWPFHRELIAESTTRMRMPPYFLENRPLRSPSAAEAAKFYEYIDTVGEEDPGPANVPSSHIGDPSAGK